MQAPEEMSGLAPILRTKTLPDDVYDTLLNMLMWGELGPDAPLSIDGLAQSLQVSPTPVREALARLEATGLVRRNARRGYRVAPPMSAEQMGELVDARLVLETGAMERAMANQAALLPELEAAFSNHETSMEAMFGAEGISDKELVRRYFQDDWSFHAAILRNCGNRYLEQAVNALSFRVHRMRQTIGSGDSDARSAVEEHRVILDAVRRGDGEGAMSAVRAHLTQLHRRVDEQN